jgi:hypothetical protein
MNVGIVGHEAKKFTPVTEAKAREVIRTLLVPGSTLVSGHCHLGGIDIWAEEEADRLGIPKLIFPPKSLDWTNGYKPRNLQIARNSAIVHCINVAAYPPGYKGMRFSYCYHCKTDAHIKSGGCWTAWRCPKRQWWIID